jgi:hypothetical protein
MPVKPIPSPLEAFESNINDAEWLLTTARGLQNRRTRRMRAELRERIGEALDVPVRERGSLDAIESDDLFIVVKPSASISRGHVADLAPLYRQAIVIAAAAIETYVCDAVNRRVGKVLYDGEPLPKYLRDLTITVGDWQWIEDNYQRRRRGLVEVCLRQRIADMASPDPDVIGQLLAMIRLENWARKLDSERRVPQKTTHTQLKELATRRNRIAHSGDRQGRGRAQIDLETSRRHVDNARSIIEALDRVLEEFGVEA